MHKNNTPFAKTYYLFQNFFSMRYIAILILLVSLWACSPTTTIYLVRHAEKQVQDPNVMMLPNDVELSAAGHARARVLKDSLHGKKLNGVYATTIRRTQQTVEPTAHAKGLIVIPYAATQPAANALIDSLVSIKGKTFAVAGHSNTVPAMVRHLGLPCSFSGNIPDDDYDNYFIITVKKGVKTVRETTYGAISP
jgi:phosphohistidine phosphatase SixA